MKMWVTSKHVLYIKNFVTFWNWIAIYLLLSRPIRYKQYSSWVFMMNLGDKTMIAREAGGIFRAC